MSLLDDLAGWEDGRLGLSDVEARHPGQDVRGLVSLHVQLAVAGSFSAPDPMIAWEKLRIRLPDRRPGMLDRLARWARIPAIVVAVSLMLGGTALALTLEPVRDAIGNFLGEVFEMFGGERPRAPHSAGNPDRTESSTPTRGDEQRPARVVLFAQTPNGDYVYREAMHGQVPPGEVKAAYVVEVDEVRSVVGMGAVVGYSAIVGSVAADSADPYDQTGEKAGEPPESEDSAAPASDGGSPTPADGSGAGGSSGSGAGGPTGGSDGDGDPPGGVDPGAGGDPADPGDSGTGGPGDGGGPDDEGNPTDGGSGGGDGGNGDGEEPAGGSGDDSGTGAGGDAGDGGGNGDGNGGGSGDGNGGGDSGGAGDGNGGSGDGSGGDGNGNGGSGDGGGDGGGAGDGNGGSGDGSGGDGSGGSGDGGDGSGGGGSGDGGSGGGSGDGGGQGDGGGSDDGKVAVPVMETAEEEAEQITASFRA
jgi:hypothetical protein